jgi:arsenate reductase
VHPLAVAVMDEIGIDLSDHTADALLAHTGTRLDIVATVCDDAAEACPFVSARKKNLHRGFDDPAAVTGSDAEKRAAFRRVRDELADWIETAFDPAAPAEAEPTDAA